MTKIFDEQLKVKDLRQLLEMFIKPKCQERTYPLELMVGLTLTRTNLVLPLKTFICSR